VGPHSLFGLNAVPPAADRKIIGCSQLSSRQTVRRAPPSSRRV
jgi:hypothetical protein